jgi:hypothetical protein
MCAAVSYLLNATLEHAALCDEADGVAILGSGSARGLAGIAAAVLVVGMLLVHLY